MLHNYDFSSHAKLPSGLRRERKNIASGESEKSLSTQRRARSLGKTSTRGSVTNRTRIGAEKAKLQALGLKKSFSRLASSDWKKTFSSRLRWPLRFRFQFSLCRRRVNNKWKGKSVIFVKIFLIVDRWLQIFYLFWYFSWRLSKLLFWNSKIN